jgi:hypothetical protein
MTSHEDFEVFKERVQFWSKEFGLTEWCLYFYHERIEDRFATCAANYRGKVASFVLNMDWDEEYKPHDWTELDRTARHEVIHLLLAPLEILARERFTTEGEITAVVEGLVRRIEAIMDR